MCTCEDCKEKGSSQREDMRCTWVKEYMRKGIAHIGREGRTLSPFRGGSGGAGRPPWAYPRGTWGEEIINTLALLYSSVLVQVQSLKSSRGLYSGFTSKKNNALPVFVFAQRAVSPSPPPSNPHATPTHPHAAPSGGKTQIEPRTTPKKKRRSYAACACQGRSYAF